MICGNVTMKEALTWKANCPEKSYMPQECMRLRVFRTASGLSTRSPVIGQKPPLARVAAMTLALSHVTSMEHNWQKWREINNNRFIMLPNVWYHIHSQPKTYESHIMTLYLPGSRSRGWRSCLFPQENTERTKTLSHICCLAVLSSHLAHSDLFKKVNYVACKLLTWAIEIKYKNIMKFGSVFRLNNGPPQASAADDLWPYLLLLQVVADGKVSVSRLALRLETGTHRKKERNSCCIKLKLSRMNDFVSNQCCVSSAQLS